MDDLFYDPELELLGNTGHDDDAFAGPNHALRTAPVFTGDALQLLGASVMPQRALYGRVVAQRGHNFAEKPTNPKVYINTNAPFSALVCGVQGSGKSHSTSVLLESCLMSDARLGTLPAPLSALVFHFDTAAGGGVVQPCEAAYLAALDTERGGDATPPTVTVLVLPNNLQAMKRVYAGLPSVKVEPLHFSAEDISGERLLAMMKVDENTQMPLYMEAIMSILRSMESNFDYVRFRDQLKEQKFNPGQKAMLNLRLSLLDSCLQGGTLENRVSTHFRKGQLTIIDLSSPFMDGTSACGFFDLILGLFVEADIDVAGKLIVLDEAHKYLSESQSGTSARLTDSLLTVIRQQRHLATRVVISTQEPTVVPSKFLDLCSFIIAHRFSSPKWLRLLANHVSAADDSFDELFGKIVSLPTGHAIMFAPNGLGVRVETKVAETWADNDDLDESPPNQEVAPIGQGYLHVHSRLRVTRDGGHSILAVSDPDTTTRLGRVHACAEAQDSGRTETHATAATQHAPDTSSLGLWTDLYSPDGRATSWNASSSDSTTSTSSPPPPSWDPSMADRYKPILDFLLERHMVKHCAELTPLFIKASLTNMQATRYDGDVIEAINQAALQGLVAITSRHGQDWVSLLPKGRALATPPPSITPVLAATPSTAASTAAKSQTIDLSKHQRFLPMMKHILSVISPGSPKTLSTSRIQQWFIKNSQHTYGTKLRTFKQLCLDAVNQGILASNVALPTTPAQLTTIKLVPNARYCNYFRPSTPKCF